MSDTNSSAFIIDHELIPDNLLLFRFKKVLFGYSDPTTISYSAIISNFGSHDLSELSLILKTYIDSYKWPDNIISINSNFINIAQKGYEHYIKRSKYDDPLQGNGSSFGSSIEFIVELEDNIYRMILFPTEGKFQIPGVKMNDLSDARDVANTVINMFKNMVVKTLFISLGNMYIIEENKNLINYNFKLYRISPRIVIAIHDLQKIFINIMEKNIAYTKYVDDRYNIIVTKSKLIENMLGVTIWFSKTYKISLKIRPNGIIALHAAKSEDDVKLVYKLLSNIIYDNWSTVIKLVPLP